MTTKFAFYGRVSTEDRQDERSSRAWQRSRAEGLIEPHGGAITHEFFDVGQSRSLPWARRPEASRLLELIRSKEAPFGAVVIGEPARAFYDNQFSLTFPVLAHFGVELWVPEVGGVVDPGSEAHDMLMNLYGGMAKGERQRIKVRVRAAMRTQASEEGRFLGGRPPYGYALVDAGAHPNPAKAAMGLHLHMLEPDRVAAPVVKRIFDEYLSGSGFGLIAEGLNRDGVPSPSGYDPGRNPHRASARGAWSKGSVRAILMNPRYTGFQVWNKQRRQEDLIDVDNVGLGRKSKQVWNDQSDWVWSAKPSHQAIISGKDFEKAQRVLSAGRHNGTAPRVRKSKRVYKLSGLLYCAECGRRMVGTFNRHVRYRCNYLREYAGVKGIRHLNNVYVREDAIERALDDWLGELFLPKNVANTAEQLVANFQIDEGAEARTERARRALIDCDARLKKLRKTLDAGGDPQVIAGWINEVQGQRIQAERELARAAPPKRLTLKEARALLKDTAAVMRRLRNAKPELKRALLRELISQAIYNPATRTVKVQVAVGGVCTNGRVGAGI